MVKERVKKPVFLKKKSNNFDELLCDDDPKNLCCGNVKDQLWNELFQLRFHYFKIKFSNEKSDLMPLLDKVRAIRHFFLSELKERQLAYMKTMFGRASDYQTEGNKENQDRYSYHMIKMMSLFRKEKNTILELTKM